jgi:outer membrane protein assembly factor BamB
LDIAYSATTGQQLWVKNITYPSGPSTSFDYYMGPMADGVFTVYNALAEQWYGYSTATGDKLWTTVADTNAWGSEPGQSSTIAYGILYGLATDGIHAYNLTTGNLLWNFDGTNSGTNFPGFNTYPFVIASMTVADGMIYVNTGVSHGDPNFRGAQLYCINATTGKLIWSISDFSEQLTMPISDGILVVPNMYDNQLYAYGMGPSKTTVTAPDVGVTTSTPVTITGTVTDISAGAQQQAVAANFPNGLPCVSDASMTQWMEYVYMQQPCPTNTTGVPVTISVIDSNGNTRQIGTTTSNAYGTYSLNWTPNIPGNYTVIASFAGTQSYYPSTAATAFYASVPSATPAPTAAPLTGLATMSGLTIGIAAAVIAIIIAIAIVGLLLIRKKP